MPVINVVPRLFSALVPKMRSGVLSEVPWLNQISAARFLLVLGCLLALAQSANAQLSKGQQILLNRGLQVQGMVNSADIFHFDTYTNANYSAINWFYSSVPSAMGPAPGFPWGRWVSQQSEMPPSSDEASYMSQLVTLSLSDEPYMDSTNNFINMLNWYTNVQPSFPNTILYVNNWGGELSDGALSSFIAQAHADMMTFDLYPWLSVYDTNYPNSIGPPIGGAPTGWYTELRRYRAYASGYGIPFGIYRQTFHAVESGNSRVFRDPSPSELRVNTFGALAFNAKVLIDFTYNTGASSLFNRNALGQWPGDTLTNNLYLEQSDINLRARNFGRALVCLKPVLDLHNQSMTNPPPPGPVSTDPCACLGPAVTTSIMFLQGRVINGGVTNASPLPGSFQPDPASSPNPANPANLIYSWWEFGTNDPYLNGWGVVNKGTNNSALPGEVLVAWFKLLDERMDGTAFTNEVYFMVVNGLVATNGSAADCLQQIKLNFKTGNSGITAVNMLDSLNGVITTNTMPVIGGTGAGTVRQLVLNLNGGDAALFKFADGAPFVGFVPPARPTLSMQLAAGQPVITLQGTSGARYALQSSPTPSGATWTTLTNTVLLGTTLTYTNSSASGSSFYRALGIP
jgi:hypothetical protein